MILWCKILSQEGAKAPYLIQAQAFAYFCLLDSKRETFGNNLQLFTHFPQNISRSHLKKAINICCRRERKFAVLKGIP